MKRFVLCFFTCVMLLLLPRFSALGESGPTLRGLLIGSDHFLTKEDTWPSTENNLKKLAHLMETDARGYLSLQVYYNEIATVPAFEAAVDHAFTGASPGDISLVYLSTHGVYDAAAPITQAALYLSDGLEENLLTAQTLADCLKKIPGKKILLLDGCNTGAFIGKGLAQPTVSHPFTGDEFIVITSSGASEPSWQWQGGTSSETGTGGSYFADVLYHALGGRHAADLNKDQQITLQELFSYLTANCAASTPQRYPEADSPLVLFACADQQDVPASPLPPITDITFEDTLLTAGQTDVLFHFTVHRPIALYYQVVYYHNGTWNFEEAQLFQDNESDNGLLAPGRKQRRLSLDMQDSRDHGYAMVQFLVMEDQVLSFQGARLLCVQPQLAEPALSVVTGAVFSPAVGEEMGIIVHHAVPCALSVTIRDSLGKTVRRLSYAQPSRPQQLSPHGSTFVWDGCDYLGRPAPEGEYTIHVDVRMESDRFTAQSLPFLLSNENEVTQP